MQRSDDPVIVPATRADNDCVAQIIRDSFADVALRFGLTPQNCPTHPSTYTGERIAADLERGVRYFILTGGGIDIGCVGLEQASQRTCYLERLAVLPHYRGNGYGTCLARYGIHRAQALGAATVGIGIIAADRGLRRFYEGLQFHAGTIQTFAHLPFDVMFMHRSV